MNLSEVSSLPAVLDAHEVAKACNVGVDHVYAQVRAGTWPTPVLRIGRALRFPTVPLLAALGIDISAPEPATP